MAIINTDETIAVPGIKQKYPPLTTNTPIPKGKEPEKSLSTNNLEAIKFVQKMKERAGKEETSVEPAEMEKATKILEKKRAADREEKMNAAYKTQGVDPEQPVEKKEVEGQQLANISKALIKKAVIHMATTGKKKSYDSIAKANKITKSKVQMIMAEYRKFNKK